MTSDAIEAVLLQHKVEQFLYNEAYLLDSWSWQQWLELFAEDVRYWMPLRKNRLRRERGDTDIPTGLEVSLVDGDIEQLRFRVQQMSSGRHWAEEPPSRCRRFITNICVRPAGEQSEELAVRSNFIVYRNRLETEVDIWAGEREDILRPSGGSFLIAKRTIMLDQNVVLSKNLSVFF